MRRLIGLALTGLLVAGPALAGSAVVLEDWTTQPLGARGIPAGWRGQTWGRPAYDLTVELDGDARVLRLRSRDEGSTITKEIRGQVDLRATPILEWRWKAVELPAGGDSRRKAADDQAAQLFVVWPRSPEFLRSRILGYVWDTTAPVGTVARSEKTGTVTYIVIRYRPGRPRPLGHRAAERPGGLPADLRRGARGARRDRALDRHERHAHDGGGGRGRHSLHRAMTAPVRMRVCVATPPGRPILSRQAGPP